MEKCRLAVIGIGQRGCAFLKDAALMSEIELVAVCDSDLERADDFLRELGLSSLPRFRSTEEMLATLVPDAAIVVTPDFAHAESAVPLLKRGIPILLEKPMAPTLADCQKILSAQKDSRALIQMGFELRAHPMFKKIKEILLAGTLGQIMSIQADESIGVMHGASYMRRWHRKSKNSGGFLLAKCSHDLDLLCWYAGELPQRVVSFGGCDFFRPDKLQHEFCSECNDLSCRFRFRGEMVKMSAAEKAVPSRKGFDRCVYTADKDVVDNQQLLLEFPSGLRATFSLNLFASPAKRSWKIIGSAGYLLADDDSCCIQLLYSDGRTSEEINCKIVGDSGHEASDKFYLRNFIDNVMQKHTSPVDSGVGYAVNRIADAAECSRRTGTVVQLSPEA